MCCKPLVAFNFGTDSETGKEIIQIKRVPLDYDLQSFLHEFRIYKPFLIPCGHCPECLTNYRKEWATRCVCESQYHKDSIFLTLTYDEVHHRKIDKNEIRQFIKSLRNDGIECRYFACGELGTRTSRNHYHCILFGYRPDDLKFYSKSSSGCRMYTSKYLQEKWNKGLVIVQDFSKKTASYVAGYVSKKIGASDGFLMMSTHPGLGYQYYLDHKYQIYKTDQIYLGLNGIGKVPRYFLKLLEKDGFDLTHIKESRQIGSKERLALLQREHNLDLMDHVLIYQRNIAVKKYNRLVRPL